jgi:hydrophobic/amphiphilic exporter-1 (mainly G- bacteria), HAE1 family
MVAGGRAKFQAFPDIDGDVILARVLMPQGTPLASAEAVAERLTESLARIDEELAPRQPSGERLIRSVSVQFGRNIDAHEGGPHVLTVSADLLSADRRDAPIDELLASWREKSGPLPDVLNIRFAEPAFGPAGWPIFIRIQGDDLARLKSASLDAQRWLQTFPGVLDLSDDLRPGKPEIRLKLAAGATDLGFDARAVSAQLRAAFHGRIASEIQVGAEEYEIDVRLAAADRDGFADLDFFHLTTRDGHSVPIAAVADLERSRGWARIAHVDGTRTVSIQADVDTSTSNTADILGEFQREYLPEFEKRFPDLRVDFEGEIAESATTQSSMLTGMAIGVLGIFVLLSFQFRSYIEPLIVMVAIPFALIGVVWGHLLMGLNLSMPSLLGLVSLAGIVVNDSILLVVFVKTRIGEGMAVSEAAGRASRDRFRAVLLTSLTTILGLIPLLLEKSLQAQILIPLATSIVFGLLASTLLILLVIPALYGILDDLGLTRRPTTPDAG